MAYSPHAIGIITHAPYCENLKARRPLLNAGFYLLTINSNTQYNVANWNEFSRAYKTFNEHATKICECMWPVVWPWVPSLTSDSHPCELAEMARHPEMPMHRVDYIVHSSEKIMLKRTFTELTEWNVTSKRLIQQLVQAITQDKCVTLQQIWPLKVMCMRQCCIDVMQTEDSEIESMCVT